MDAKLDTLPKQNVRWYGWKPDKPDPRDYEYKPTAIRIPATGGLNAAMMPKVLNQGDLGSCTGCSATRALMYLHKLSGQPDCNLSPLFAYYNARVIEGTTSEDAGAEIRDMIKGIAKIGTCEEQFWPYDITKYASKPPPAAYSNAKEERLRDYRRIASTGMRRVNSVKNALVKGFPVNFGFTVFQSFEGDEVAQTGLLPMPSKDEESVGGHAVWAYRWDDVVKVGKEKGAFLIRNSWGDDWGLKGDFWMPYAYVADANLSDDYWALRVVS